MTTGCHVFHPNAAPNAPPATPIIRIASLGPDGPAGTPVVATDATPRIIPRSNQLNFLDCDHCRPITSPIARVPTGRSVNAVGNALLAFDGNGPHHWRPNGEGVIGSLTAVLRIGHR